MLLSDDLPTAVDYTNILVNYVEVSADDIPKAPAEQQEVPKGVYPPQVLHESTEVTDHEPNSVTKTKLVEGEPKAEPVYWGKEFPKYLHDVDLSERAQRYQRAAKGVNEFSTPPGLPLFLGKSILNGTTPMKDDSSVLNMPNHTVLNHLATSSIKNDVLATSITTRYKRKVIDLARPTRPLCSPLPSTSQRSCTSLLSYPVEIFIRPMDRPSPHFGRQQSGEPLTHCPRGALEAVGHIVLPTQEHPSQSCIANRFHRASYE